MVTMLRNLRKFIVKNNLYPIFIQKNTFLTNEYKCLEAWHSQTSSDILNKVNLHDFYNIIDQNYSSKGLISAIDVDIFANAIKEPGYLEELKDLLHKLRLSAETGSTLESTHHATVRKFIEYGHIPELLDILRDPLNFGVFLDDYSANILLDNLITLKNYELAANVASLVMLQESYINDITCTLCQYACYKFILAYVPEPPIPEDKKKVEEIKIRVKFLRNPYFDDHFDIKDILTKSGKTLAWISERASDNLNNNLQIVGWLFYKKYDKLLLFCETFTKTTSSKIFPEVIELLLKECDKVEPDHQTVLQNCLENLNKVALTELSLEDSLKIAIENAINKTQSRDISDQEQLFRSWTNIRKQKLEEQTKRLDRAKRMQAIQKQQDELKQKEQKLWFFKNEEKIDLEIEDKEKLVDNTQEKKSSSKKIDENYIPPEILPKRK